MPLIDGQVTAMALKPRKQILAQWYVNLAGGSVADYATLPSGQLYAKIAAHYGPKTEGDYTRLPVSYAYHDIYEAVSGVTTNDYGWGESFALANIYAAIRGQANNKGKIVAYRDYNRSILLALIVFAPVAAPSNLIATGISTSQINLSWTDNSNNELGFKIERSTDNINFTQIAQVGAGVVTYQSTGLDEGVQYYYRVRAFQGAVNSQYSNTASAATILTAPSLLTATAITDVRIDLAWQDNSSGETGFRIERSTDNINFTQIDEVGANVTTYQSTGLTANTQYYYRVRAFRTTVNSAYSNTANATTFLAETITFATASGATDIVPLNDLFKYVVSEGLWSNFRIYPQKGAQNANAGSTVYGAGGLTSNNGTLIGSPTWGSDGISYNGSNQCCRIADFLGTATLTVWARLSQGNTGAAASQTYFSQSDSAGDQRSITFVQRPSGDGSTARLIRYSVGTSIGTFLEAYDTASNVSSTSNLSYVVQWIAGGGRGLWINKNAQSITRNAGLDQSSKLNTSVDVLLAATLGSGSPASFLQATYTAAAFLEGVTPTTTQRETITDLINAL